MVSVPIALVDSSGGVVSATNTIVDCGAGYTQATMNAQMATLAAQINNLRKIVYDLLQRENQ